MRHLAKLVGAAVLGLAAFAAHAESGQNGGTLVIGSTQVPRHLNGAVQSGIATAVPSAQIFASPLRYDESWEPQPYLAESWETSPDGLAVTLNLVQGAVFHDGVPITSADVAFSIMASKAHHPFTSMFAPVEAVETPDPHTAIIRLSAPHPALLLALSPALAPVLPQHIYGDGQDIQTHPANTTPIGSGPFKLTSFVADEAVVLERNKDFFIDGRPKLDRIIIRTIKDPSALLIALETGETDLYPFMVSAFEVKRLAKSERLTIIDDGYAAVGAINWLAFNTASPKLSDVRVRQAIAYATDRSFITKQLHLGLSTPQRGPIIETSPYFASTIPSYDVDLGRARALMDEAGFGDGMALTIDFIPGSIDQQRRVAEYLRSQLAKIGITLTVRASPDFPSWAKRISQHDFELTMDIVFNWADPVIGVHRTYLSSNIKKGVIWSNTQQYRNERVDAVLNAAAIEQDPTKRAALYAEFQHLVAEDLPVYWINALPYHTAYDNRLGGVPKGIWGAMHPMDQVFWKTPK